MKYVKKDFVRYFAKYAKIKQRDSKKIVNWTLLALRDFLSTMQPGDHLVLSGFGAFKVFYYRARTNLRNLKTKEPSIMSARRRLVFRSSINLKRSMKKLN